MASKNSFTATIDETLKEMDELFGFKTPAEVFDGKPEIEKEVTTNGTETGNGNDKRVKRNPANELPNTFKPAKAPGKTAGEQKPDNKPDDKPATDDETK